jgi:glycosyltransferase involved in cell wall biosynthesis
MRERISLLQIVDSLQPGGMENILAQVLTGLDQRAYELEVVCLTQGGPFERRLPEHVRVRVLSKKAGFQMETVRRLRAILRERPWDVVHTHHLGGLIYVAAAAGLRLLTRPRLLHSEHIVWDGDELSRKRRWQRRLLYGLADTVFAVSAQQTAQITACGLRPRRLLTLLNGVDSQKFCPSAEGAAAVRHELGLAQPGRWLGMVARFAPAKRHLELIEAFEQVAVASSELRLLLVGDGGPERDRVLKRLEHSSMRERIHWAGFQAKPEDWYRAMDVLVMPSASEGLPNAALEAMASGLPLLANDVCGVREVAESGKHGWIGDYSTVRQLVNGLQDLAVVSQAELTQRGQQARQHVEKKFSLAAMVQRYDQLFRALAGRAGNLA